jgi:hypothetical protein
VERTEDLVVLEIERPCGLEVSLEGSDVRRLDNKLLGSAQVAELLVTLGAREPGVVLPCSATVVVV